MIEKTFNQGLDPTKWSDIRKEFFDGAYRASVSGATSVAVVAFGTGVTVVAFGTGVDDVIVGTFAVVAGAVGAVAVVAGAVGVAGSSTLSIPTHERLVARNFGFASGLVVPIALVVALGHSLYKSAQNNQIRNAKATASVPANCNRTAVDQEIKKLEDLGFKITCP